MKTLRVKNCGGSNNTEEEIEKLKERIKELVDQVNSCQVSQLEESTVAEHISKIENTVNSPSLWGVCDFISSCCGLGFNSGLSGWSFEVAEDFLDRPLISEDDKKIRVPNFDINILHYIDKLCNCLSEKINQNNNKLSLEHLTLIKEINNSLKLNLDNLKYLENLEKLDKLDKLVDLDNSLEEIQKNQIKTNVDLDNHLIAVNSILFTILYYVAQDRVPECGGSEQL